jgi:Calcineurin-like phosphoesterase
MRLVVIADTHGYHRQLKIPSGDVLIHAGDYSRYGNYSELEDFVCWMAGLPHKHKIFIAGNHDSCLEAMRGVDHALISSMAKTGKIKDLKGAPLDASGLYYLRDSSVEINGKIFYGAPWQPDFMDWSFQRARGPEMAEKWKLIPDKVDVLITHGPAYGHGDLCPPYLCAYQRNAGCLELLRRIKEIGPQIHICGHIHCGYGLTESDECPKTIFVNASTCTEAYKPDHPPLEIDIA